MKYEWSHEEKLHPSFHAWLGSLSFDLQAKQGKYIFEKHGGGSVKCVEQCWISVSVWMGCHYQSPCCLSGRNMMHVDPQVWSHLITDLFLVEMAVRISVSQLNGFSMLACFLCVLLCAMLCAGPVLTSNLHPGTWLTERERRDSHTWHMCCFASTPNKYLLTLVILAYVTCQSRLQTSSPY